MVYNQRYEIIMVRYDGLGEDNTDNMIDLSGEDVVDLSWEDNVVDLSDWYYGL